MKTYCLTQHYNHSRTGWNPHETKLKLSNVNPVRFGRLFTQSVEGTVYAQPLYLPDVDIPRRGRHNVIFVATENDVVYAFDADKDDAPLWRHHLARPGETSVSVGDIEGCDNIAPRIGITGTPVIDLKSKTLYLVMKTKRVSGGTPTFHQYLCALDIHTGKHRHKSPKEIRATAPGSGQKNDGHGNVIFLPQWQMNRPGLLLMKDSIYVGFGGHCDFHPGEYHGWVLSFHAKSLHHQATFITSPNSGLTGIWQGGMGLAADSDHFIYFTTGNGVFNASTGGCDYGDTVLKLDRHLAVQSSFTPADQATLLYPADVDLGSGGVLILPDQPSSPSHPRMLVTCGKDGDIFLLDRSNLGGYTGPGGTNPQAVQTLPLQPGKPKSSQPGIWGGPAYYHGPGGQFVYYCGDGGQLTAFKLQSGLLSPATLGGGTPNQSSAVYGAGGTTPVVSSNKKIGGTAIVWTINRSNPLRLQAYDATNLTTLLYDDNAGPWNNPDGGAFIEPTVANGRVYVASDGELAFFGLK